MIFVVDTNVAVTANGKSEQTSPECVLNCTKRLQQLIDIESIERLTLDDQWIILKEYIRHLKPEGQPGVGDAFLRWVLLNRTTGRCELVKLTPYHEDNMDFEEFPRDKRLKKFDRADRKWIAVSRAHSEHPPVLQATDMKWAKFVSTFAEHGVKVDFLCSEA
jgi:hypothetical protein